MHPAHLHIAGIDYYHGDTRNPGDEHSRRTNDLVYAPHHGVEFLLQNTFFGLGFAASIDEVDENARQIKHASKPTDEANDMERFQNENGVHFFLAKV